jgi:hypothetical protein
VPTYSVGTSLKVFSLQTTNFSSEVGAVLTFFAYFFASRQKSEWGAGLAPTKTLDYFIPITKKRLFAIEYI